MPEGAYPRALDPIARPGDVLRLDPLDELREVLFFIVQPGVNAFQTQISVAANDTEADNEATELEMPDTMLGQFRMVHPGEDLTDGINVTVDQQGQQAPLFTTKKARGFYDDQTGTMEGNDGASVVGNFRESRLTEVYVWEDNPPFYTFENTTGGSLNIQNIRFAGYHYKLGPVLDRAPDGRTPVAVPISRIREGESGLA